MDKRILIVGGAGVALLFLTSAQRNNNDKMEINENTQLSKDFKLLEFFRSKIANDYGINNTTRDPQIIVALKELCNNVLQPLRNAVNAHIIVNSGFRVPQVNERAGGKSNSQHLTGHAADIYCATLTPYQLAKTLLGLGLPFDQLGMYGTFIHVSYVHNGNNRKQIFYDNSYNGKRF